MSSWEPPPNLICLPELLPGQHLYSYLADIHQFSGHISPTKSQKWIANDAGPLKTNNKPRPGLFRLSRLLSDAFGFDFLQLSLGHTVLHFFRPILRPQELNAIQKLAESSTNGSHDLKLNGLSSFNPRTWRFCHVCAEEDDSLYGRSYWHAKHQTTGVCFCYRHPGQQLTQSCSACSYHWDDLRSCGPPPHNGQCPKCGMAIHGTPERLVEEQVRLDQQLIQWLNFGLHAVDQEAVQLLFCDTLGIPPDGVAHTVSNNKMLKQLQADFDASLSDSLLHGMLKSVSRYRTNNQISYLSVFQICYARKYIQHPISLIFMANHLGIPLGRLTTDALS